MSVIDIFHSKDFTMLRTYFVKCLVVSQCCKISTPNPHYTSTILHLSHPTRPQPTPVLETVRTRRCLKMIAARPAEVMWANTGWLVFHVHEGRRATLYAGSEDRYAGNWMR